MELDGTTGQPAADSGQGAANAAAPDAGGKLADTGSAAPAATAGNRGPDGKFTSTGAAAGDGKGAPAAKAPPSLDGKPTPDPKAATSPAGQTPQGQTQTPPAKPAFVPGESISWERYEAIKAERAREQAELAELRQQAQTWKTLQSMGIGGQQQAGQRPQQAAPEPQKPDVSALMREAFGETDFEPGVKKGLETVLSQLAEVRQQNQQFAEQARQQQEQAQFASIQQEYAGKIGVVRQKYPDLGEDVFRLHLFMNPYADVEAIAEVEMRDRRGWYDKGYQAAKAELASAQQSTASAPASKQAPPSLAPAGSGRASPQGANDPRKRKTAADETREFQEILARG